MFVSPSVCLSVSHTCGKRGPPSGRVSKNKFGHRSPTYLCTSTVLLYVFNFILLAIFLVFFIFFFIELNPSWTLLLHICPCSDRSDKPNSCHTNQIEKRFYIRSCNVGVSTPLINIPTTAGVAQLADLAAQTINIYIVENYHVIWRLNIKTLFLCITFYAFLFRRNTNRIALVSFTRGPKFWFIQILCIQPRNFHHH